jgi:hypothetical protein
VGALLQGDMKLDNEKAMEIYTIVLEFKNLL